MSQSRVNDFSTYSSALNAAKNAQLQRETLVADQQANAYQQYLAQQQLQNQLTAQNVSDYQTYLNYYLGIGYNMEQASAQAQQQVARQNAIYPMAS